MCLLMLMIFTICGLNGLYIVMTGILFSLGSFSVVDCRSVALSVCKAI